MTDAILLGGLSEFYANDYDPVSCTYNGEFVNIKGNSIDVFEADANFPDGKRYVVSKIYEVILVERGG